EGRSGTAATAAMRTIAGRTSHQGVAWEALQIGKDPVRVDVEPVLEQRGVDRAEVDGLLEISVLVEPMRQARKLADHLMPDALSQQEGCPGSTVIGAVGVVLLCATTEFAPQQCEHAPAEPSTFEILLKGEQGVGDVLQTVRESARLVRVGVVF